MQVPPVQKYVPLGVTYPQYSNMHSTSGRGSGSDVYNKDSTVEEDFGLPVDSSVIDGNISAVNHSVESSYIRSPPRKSPSASINNTSDAYSTHNTHANATHNTRTNYHTNYNTTSNTNTNTNASTVNTSNTTPPRSKLPTSWTATPADSSVRSVDDSNFEYTPMDAHYARSSGATSSGVGSMNTNNAQHHATHHTTHHTPHPTSTTHTNPAHESFTYSDLQDTSILDQSIDSIISSALYPPAADISWTQNDSYHTHFTGTDKDIHVSPGYGSGGKVSSGDRGGSNGSGYSGVSGTVLQYDNINASTAHHTTNANTTHSNTYTKSVYNSHIPARTTTQSPARAEREASKFAHNQEIQAIYSDIGRLGGKLGVKLRSASPSSSTSSARGGGAGSAYQGRK